MHQLLLRGEPISRVNGILFDKDGTLISSEERLLKLAKSRIKEAIKAYAKYTKSKNDIEYLLSKAYGITANGINPNGSMAIASKKDNLISTATIFSILGMSWSNSLQISHDIFQKATVKDTESNNNESKDNLLPGVQNLLKECNKKGIKLGVISNDTKDGIKQFLRNNNLEKKIPYFWSSEDYPPKPNPTSVKNLCKLMNLKVSECILIGDADTDLKMARSSGTSLALGYTAGWKNPPLLYEHHHLLNHWDELSFQ
ncbi:MULTISPECIES: HAD family hydrolase [Prochlorococcus]|uniref:Predicted HAD superfamily phosphatase n=1 Tax=Prochlorococcus marinus (strain SARG / CCMP1375 / SS120) TaxID=167539 RepID=Q7VDM6_PROMA|nr:MULTISPECIES: HAD-IIIA family hydrolase [Prochlorococcus]AAP99396.1 Predicted HAD superfamily phosphatase [Prochlorococcus marinus subsp. marinus str. CCMP1375]KGG11332.1 Haloacid dehalogenase/epoxide hydrolase family [Prochlorococcus marinus str. LG]KGG18712.1 Haloacid dehalogenase/epoxide hydrolase family [Prochlorococcus marinus str. SS2]KGG22986.1 Haloacid dehalogenase/epoxide hydrolase family [Prochlorococcus marinus str. SS35]KGG34090.1 Haloacid dehalogenase/epoxide hydrolase family [